MVGVPLPGLPGKEVRKGTASDGFSGPRGLSDRKIDNRNIGKADARLRWRELVNKEAVLPISRVRGGGGFA